MGVVLGQIQNRFRTAGQTDPVSGVTRTLVTPAVTAVDNTGRSWDAFWVNVKAGPSLRSELTRLKQEERSMKTYVQTVESLRRELAQLRTVTGLPNPGAKRVSARIIGYFAYEDRVTLSAGAAQGVKVGMPVISADGLLAVVQTVEPDRAQALTVTSPAVRFGGLVLRDDGVAGLMKGQTSTRLILDVLEEGKIQVGDAVVTSGFSSRFPRGIPIGTVAEVVADPNFGTRRVFVAPAVNIAATLDVWVLE